jgi:plastocyanin
VLALLATAGAGIYPVRGRDHRVDVVSFAFEPPSLTIAAGDRVVWSFDAAGHSVSATDAEWDSGIAAAGASFQHRFVTAGSFEYFCSAHDFMRGTIAVQPVSPLRKVLFWSLALVAASAAAAALRDRLRPSEHNVP